MDFVFPSVAKGADLFGFARHMGLIAILHIARGGGPLEVGVELDAIGRVEIDALDLTAQPLTLGQRGHHRQAVARDHPVRPVLIVLVELGRGLGIGQAVEIGEHVELRRVFGRLGPVGADPFQVVDDDLGVDLFLNVQRRGLDDQVGLVLLILAAPDQLWVQIAVAAFVGELDRRLVLIPHDGLELRRRNVLARGVVGEGFDLDGFFHH